MNDWSTCPAAERHPNVVSGAWVFRGTRVPLHALFENLRDGATIDEFLQWFPGVTREQVQAVLDHEASRNIPFPKQIDESYREQFLGECDRAYSSLKAEPEAWQEMLRERQEWDRTLQDGLEDA